jgi:tellurite resistance protein TehA-like permease
MRFAWILVVVGLMIAAGSAFGFYLRVTANPDLNDPLQGFLMAAGFWTGIVVAIVGGAMVARARGIKTPPL